MKRAIVGIMLIFFSLTLIWSQVFQGLEKELDRLKSDFALILPSHEVKDYPLWSADSKFIAGHVGNDWVKVDLNRVSLMAGYWRGKQPIGVMKYQPNVSLASDLEISQWKNINKVNPQQITTRSNLKIEFKRKDYDSSLWVSKNASEELIWTANSETCHSLVLSQDEKFLAFICDKNGLIILQLKKWS